MAAISVGSDAGARRNPNHELPLVPFIDFLLCLVAFLLVTAVWSALARLPAEARVPGGEPTTEPAPATRRLHLDITTPDRFRLTWKEGNTVLSMDEVPRRPVRIGDHGDLCYPELSRALEEQWHKHGQHRSPGDTALDHLILHAQNQLEFAELSAMLDAANAPMRPSASLAGGTASRAAFRVSLAVD
jgi:hypothetical protein